MSEIRVTTLKDTGGGNSSTSAEIYSGRAKAWVNFNGQGTVAIRAQFNVNSITDLDVGVFKVNFASSLSDASIAVSGFCCSDGPTGDRNMVVASTTTSDSGSVTGPSSSSICFKTIAANTASQFDQAVNMISVFR